jgi:replicative DNA helicase Mcm
MQMPQLTIQESALAAKWTSFLEDYCKDRIQQAALDYPETRSITIPFNDIQLRDPDLANQLLARPSTVLRVGTAMMHQVDVTVEPRPKIHLRVNGMPESQQLKVRDLRAEHLGKFMAVDGLVKKVTEVRPTVLEAVFECKVCTTKVVLLQEEEFLQEPALCETCDAQRPWRLVEEECRYLDHQKVEIQEAPEGLRGGAQPERLTVHMQDDLVQRLAPGDRVRLNGILATLPRRQGSQKRVEFNKVLQTVSVELQQQEFSEVNWTAEEEDQIKTIAEDPRVFDRLRASFAPTIGGMEDQKDALIMSLFGGVEKNYKDGSRSRGDIHVLLVGDPGVAKSQLLRYMSKLAPRAIFTSGKGASAAGLTAAAVKDEFGEGQWTLEAGALVLADRGICCIDELDKMDKNDQSSMHQAMEQQEISIAKAGISATLKSRCAVIGAANPKSGRFDAFAPPAEQINMPPALMSRFDMIFSIKDKPSRDKDNALAEHILKTHQGGEVREHRRVHPTGTYTSSDEDQLMRRIQPEIAAELLRKYVAYAKSRVFPVLTEDALRRIQDYYVDLRSSGQDEAVPITARQLEAFVRLAEASARIRLSETATLDDAERAIHMMELYLHSVGVDRETGKLDIDVIATGVSHSQQDRMRQITDIVRQLSLENPKKFATQEDIIREAGTKGMRQDLVTKSLEQLLRNGTLYRKGGEGTYAMLS